MSEKEISLKITLPEDILTEVMVLGMRKKPTKQKANEVIQEIVIGHIARLLQDVEISHVAKQTEIIDKQSNMKAKQ